jgi:hypothetical protein
MGTHDLIGAFQNEHTEYQRIYWETLPPGVIVDQVVSGALVIGNLRMTINRISSLLAKNASGSSTEKGAGSPSKSPMPGTSSGSWSIPAIPLPYPRSGGSVKRRGPGQYARSTF